LNNASIHDQLQQAGLKSTQQRIAILDELIKSKGHPSTDQIYKSLHDSYPSISLATIYKNLEMLTAAQLVRKVHSSDGTLRYDANLTPHHHIYCENTSEILDFEDDDLNKLIAGYFEKKRIKNFKINEISLQISGEKIVDIKDVSII
jgi:Fur family peroxide stress response transcriptional regulator